MIPKTVVGIAMLLWKLAPPVRASIALLLQALLDGDDDAARKAYEQARRTAFMARQK